MDVEIVFIEGCPHASVTSERVLAAARQVGVPVEVRNIVVANAGDAQAVGMRGSPTVLVEGIDVAESGDGATSWSCRLYRSGDHISGAPNVATIAAAFERALPGGAHAPAC